MTAGCCASPRLFETRQFGLAVRARRAPRRRPRRLHGGALHRRERAPDLPPHLARGAGLRRGARAARLSGDRADAGADAFDPRRLPGRSRDRPRSPRCRPAGSARPRNPAAATRPTTRCSSRSSPASARRPSSRRSTWTTGTWPGAGGRRARLCGALRYRRRPRTARHRARAARGHEPDGLGATARIRPISRCARTTRWRGRSTRNSASSRPTAYHSPSCRPPLRAEGRDERAGGDESAGERQVRLGSAYPARTRISVDSTEPHRRRRRAGGCRRASFRCPTRRRPRRPDRRRAQGPRATRCQRPATPSSGRDDKRKAWRPSRDRTRHRIAVASRDRTE